MRIFFAFTRHAVIFDEFDLPKHLRYWLLLIPIAPIVLLSGMSLAFVVAAACLLPCWYMAHAQYHLLDAKGTARVKVAQKWLSRIEMLSFSGVFYVGLQLCFTTFAFILSQ